MREGIVVIPMKRIKKLQHQILSQTLKNRAFRDESSTEL